MTKQKAVSKLDFIKEVKIFKEKHGKLKSFLTQADTRSEKIIDFYQNDTIRNYLTRDSSLVEFCDDRPKLDTSKKTKKSQIITNLRYIENIVFLNIAIVQMQIMKNITNMDIQKQRKLISIPKLIKLTTNFLRKVYIFLKG